MSMPKISPVKLPYTQTSTFRAQTSEPSYKLKVTIRKVFVVKGSKAIDNRSAAQIDLAPSVEMSREVFQGQFVHALKFLIFAESKKLNKHTDYEDFTLGDSKNFEWMSNFDKHVIIYKTYLSLDDIRNNKSIDERRLNDLFKDNNLEPSNMKKEFFIVVHWPTMTKLAIEASQKSAREAMPKELVANESMPKEVVAKETKETSVMKYHNDQDDDTDVPPVQDWFQVTVTKN